MERRIDFNNHRLQWAVIGEHGAISLICYSLDFTSGAIELHSKKPLREGEEPQEKCDLVGTCYFDSSCNQYTEFLRYLLAGLFTGSTYSTRPQEAVWTMLETRYRERFHSEERINWDVPVVSKSPHDTLEAM